MARVVVCLHRLRRLRQLSCVCILRLDSDVCVLLLCTELLRADLMLGMKSTMNMRALNSKLLR
jgi:hypothetical protein